MKLLQPIALAAFAAIFSLGAQADSITVDGFTGGANPSGWQWGGADSIPTTGGNPAEYLRNTNLDTYAPQLRTTNGVASPFLGNYRANIVQSLGVDLLTLGTQFPFQRALTVILINDAGTPNDPSDDCSVYSMGAALVPQVGQGWASFDFTIPAQQAHLPAGWLVLSACSANDDVVWNNVITNVTQVNFFYGDPTNFFIFDIWQVGADNVRVTYGGGTWLCTAASGGAACPCSNPGSGLQGCRNSTGSGAFLDGTGSTSVSADTLAFTSWNMPGGSSALLIQGTSSIQLPFGDGVRCAGGSIRRMGQRAVSASGSAVWGPGLASLGGWIPGQQRVFQAWYRNPAGPCGHGFNLSSALQVTFAP